MLCEVFLVGGGRVAVVLLLVLLGAGLIAPPWIWLVAGLFLLALTLDGIFTIARMREFETAHPWSPPKAEEPGKLGEWDNDEPVEPLDATVFYNKEARRARAIGVVTWWIALPAILFAIWAWSEPVLAWINPFDAKDVIMLIVGVFLFAFFSAHPLPRTRTRRRVVLTVAVLAVMVSGLWVRHPYLRPGYPDAARVKVEQLLKTPDIPALQYHTRTLVHYAQELEARGKVREAGSLLHMAAMVDVTDADLQETFARFLTRHAPKGEDTIFYQRAADLRSGVALKVSQEP